jgi:hypothetical protein
MRARVIDVQDGFAGGLSSTVEEATLAPNEVREAKNARLIVPGAIVKRQGTQNVSAARPDAVEYPMRGFSWRPTAAAPTELLAVGGGATGKLYTGTYAIPMIWTFVSNLQNSSVFPQFAPFRDSTGECVYIAKGAVAGIQKFKAGAVTTPATSAPSVARIAVQNGRLFGCTGIDQTLWYSGLNDGDTLGVEASGGGSQIIRTFGDQQIVALAAVGSSLLIFHRTGISKFTGYAQSDISIESGTRGLTADVGTVAPDSIVVVENVCYFLSDRGFYAATEFEVRPISEKIENAISVMNQANFYEVQGVHNRAKQEVWWVMGAEGTYVFNYRLNAWAGPWMDAFADLWCAWQTLNASGEPIILVGQNGNGNGFVQRADYYAGPGTDFYLDNKLSDGTGGTAYEMVVRCHRMHLGSKTSEKAFRFAKILGDTGGSLTMYLAWSTDVGSSQSAPLGGASGTKYRRVQLGGRGYYIELEIYDDGTTYCSYERLEVEGFDYGDRY